MRSGRGFTLIEVLFALVIVAVLAGLAAPSFREMNHANRLAGAANEFVTALNLARGEAIKRGHAVTLCRSSNPNAATPACNVAAGGWETGWIVFSDRGGTIGTIDAATDTVIAVRSPLGAELLLRGNGGLLDDRLTFDTTGTPREVNNGTLRLCRDGNTVGRQIVVSATGRPRVEKITAATCP